MSALESGNPDGDDGLSKQDRLAARAARFTQTLPGNRYKELEEARNKERQAFEAQGLIKLGKTDLEDAVDLRGTCEKMCSDYEREFREWTREVNPFERIAGQISRIDPNKAVAAYTRSDAGAGHGSAAILPSDLRTPQALLRSLDYLISEVMTLNPTGIANPTQRKALGYSAGFIRDRTRAIRKEFAMQSSWGHKEAIAVFERVARWHILCLRELQEESGSNKDMHIDSAELGRCFTSLRQMYNDQREQSGLEMPCPNEPEMIAYMILFSLNQKSVSIPISELPATIIDQPIVKIAWELRNAAQRNFDSQKEASKGNAELGVNSITRYVKLLKSPNVPFLLACMAEIRLREMRRSILRAMIRTYARLKDGQPIRMNENGEVVERRMILLVTLAKILGCEPQEDEESAWDDVFAVEKNPEVEATEIARKFGLEVYEDQSGPVGVLVNAGAYFNDNEDATFTRRWQSITEGRKDIPFKDIVNGGVSTASTIATPATQIHLQETNQPGPSKPTVTAFKSAFSTTNGLTNSPSSATPIQPPAAKPSAPFAFGSTTRGSVFGQAPKPAEPPKPTAPPPSTLLPFSFGPKANEVKPAAQPATTLPPSLFNFQAPASKPQAAQSTTPPIAPLIPLTPSKSLETAPPVSTTPKSTPPATKTIFFAPPQQAESSKAASARVEALPAPPIAPPTTTPTLTPRAPPTLVSSLTASTSTSSFTRTPRKGALALTRSINRQTLPSESERMKRKAVIPSIADEMINSAVTSILNSIREDLERFVGQQTAAKEYTARKIKRTQTIEYLAKHLVDELLEDVIYDVCEDEHTSENKRRARLKRDIRLRDQTIELQEEFKEHAKRDRVAIDDYLQHMGLGRTGAVSIRSSKSEKLDEFEIDVSLLQAQRAREHIRAPSTYLHAIAKHVGPLLSPTPDSPSSSTFIIPDEPLEIPKFDILLSTAGSTDPKAWTSKNWLTKKFCGRPEESSYQYYGVTFDTIQDDVTEGTGYTGLVAFEIPPIIDGDSSNQSRDIQDARKRFEVARRIPDRLDNRYVPALLFLTWENETLEDIQKVLGINDIKESFPNHRILRMSMNEDLDHEVTNVARDLLSDVSTKYQVVIDLAAEANAMGSLFLRYCSTVQAISKLHINDAKFVQQAWRKGVHAINQIGYLVETSLAGIKPDETSTFTPMRIPEFESNDSGEDILAAVELVEGYLDDEIFTGLDELFLLASTLRQCVEHKQVMPLGQMLSALLYLVLGEMSKQTLHLQVWTSEEDAKAFEDHFYNATSTLYTDLIEASIEAITAIPPKSTYLPSPPGSPIRSTLNDSTKRSLKRSHSSILSILNDSPESRTRKESEGRKAKNAKLLKAMAEAVQTLGDMGLDGRDEIMA